MSRICIDLAVFDAAVPFALVIDPDGRVGHVGPTFEKIAPGALGRPIAEVMRFVRPAAVPDQATLLMLAGRRMRVELLDETGRRAGDTPLLMRCAVVPLADGRALVVMSLGADPSLALRRHRLSAQDFAETDSTVDMLFLHEAHGVVLREFKRLGARLDDARAAAEEEAATDKLTGLRNRRAMDRLLQRLTRQKGAVFGLMNLDLDFFKAVNDTLGHAAGDRVLERVGVILREEVRRGDTVARVGGDEFMLVFAECSDVALLERIAARIIARLEQPIDWEGNACHISGSIGIAMSSFYDRIDVERLIADADEALYASKRAGRARHSVALPA